MTPHSSINWLGTWTLFNKEVTRFLKVYNQTLVAPITSALLLLAVFSLALGDKGHVVGGVPFGLFMGSGLIIMNVVQQSFTNTSSTITMGKVIGTIIDYLMPPLTAGEIIFAMTMAGIVRGLLNGIFTAVGVSFFVPLELHHPGLMIFFVLAASMMLTLLGIIAGVLSESFDHMAAITSYVITPLAFLSGTFYSVNQLPPFWHSVSHFNPFFYMIDGFRYSMTGYADGSVMTGVITLICFNVILWLTAYIMIAKGYRLKN